MNDRAGSGGVTFRRPVFRVGSGPGLLLTIVGLAAGPPVAAQSDAWVSGIPHTGGFAVVETTGQIMARQALADRQPAGPPTILFLGRADASRKTMNPAGESLLQGPASGARLQTFLGGGGPLAPQPVGVNALGPTFNDTPGFFPPDSMGAAGPTQFVAIVNGRIRSYSKATGSADGLLDATTDTFFASVRSSSMSDPHIKYDRLSQRWFVVMIDVTFPNNRIIIAVSDAATVTSATAWSFFFFQDSITGRTNCLGDYPTPGLDANALYIGVNDFCGATLGTATFTNSAGFVVQKSSVLGAGPIHVTAFPSLLTLPTFTGPYTPQGVDNPDPAATEGYFIGVDGATWNTIQLRRVSSPGSLSPTLSGNIPITVATLGLPATQPHMGNTGGTIGRLDASDNRLFAASFRNGSLWTSMDVGTTVSGGNCVGTGTATPPAGTRDAVFWWELQGIPTGQTPSIRQAGLVCDTATTNPAFYSYGTVLPNGQGHAALGYTIAGNNNFAGAATSGRLAGDVLSSLQAINVYSAGAAAYNPPGDNGSTNGFRRWGDFSYTTVDPCNDQTLWTIQEYTSSLNTWGTRFAELKAPPPATPASASPSSVATGQASVNVVVTGTSASGSGFYDTPSSMSSEPCRLRIGAAVTAGVTVNSITYTDPTHVTLNLNTSAATPGAANVTVTNPDGQTATGNGILTISSGCTPPPTPTASNTGPYCAGGTISLSTPTVAGATYAWTGPAGFTSALQNPTIPSATTGMSGTYSVTVTVAGCTSAPGTTSVVVNAVPATPVVTAPATVGAGSPNRSASVAAHAGSTYAWGITNGTITSGQGTSQITFTAGTAGTPLTLSVTETSSAGCTSAAGNAMITVAPAGSAVLFYTVTPCRQLDTRSGGGTPLAAGATLTVALTGAPCGIAAGARSVSVNLAVTQPTGQGHLTIYPTGGSEPTISDINFGAGQTRANNDILVLSSDGTGRVNVVNGSGGTVHVILDVNGFFQ